MSSAQQLLDTAGRRRSPATLSEFHAGRAPGNKGQRYAADPPTVDEIIAVVRHARHAPYGKRLNGLIVVLWRAGLRINEALSLNETDLEGGWRARAIWPSLGPMSVTGPTPTVCAVGRGCG
jgi:integrase